MHNLVIRESTMPDSNVKGIKDLVKVQAQQPERERRAQPRSETVLSRIEDATYAILRKHEKKSA